MKWYQLADSKNSKPSEKKRIGDLSVVYVLYFDEAIGHVPLLIYPDDKYKEDKKYMRPIKYHSIWFLDIDDSEALDHIDLEYKGFIYFGKKFLTKSKRKKRRAGLKEETPETIVIILSLPTDLEIFGDDLIHILTKEIQDNFEDKLYEIIESEIAKEEIIKTPKIKKCIIEGNKVKNNLKNLIVKTTDEYFSKVTKQVDALSIKQQKAISFLTIKGLDISHIIFNDAKTGFANIKLFDPNKKAENYDLKPPFAISDIYIIEDSKEIEIIVKNNMDYNMDNITIKISHIKEFFEKEIMNQKIDLWQEDEELLFVSPIIPHINEYLFFIVEETYKGNYKKLLSKKIDLNNLNKIKS